MWFFQDIELQPTEEISNAFLWSRVYRQIHLALVSSKDENGIIWCGTAFPDYSEKHQTLGKKIRLLAPEENYLQKLNLNAALVRFASDYVKLNPIHPVPQRKCKGFAIYSRYQPEQNRRQKAKRYAKRHGISVEKAQQLFPVRQNDVPYPYIQLESLTNHQKFSLFIKKNTAEEHACEGFSAYGFSKRSSVPDF